MGSATRASGSRIKLFTNWEKSFIQSTSRRRSQGQIRLSLQMLSRRYVTLFTTPTCYLNPNKIKKDLRVIKNLAL
jgi:hypothetical protein